MRPVKVLDVDRQGRIRLPVKENPEEHLPNRPNLWES